MHRRAAQAEFACKSGRRDALCDAAQEEHDLGWWQVPGLEDGASVERVGFQAGFAAPDVELAALSLAKQVCLLMLGSAVWAREPLGVKVPQQPVGAPVVVE